jgi:hypothetical protein
VTVAKRMMTGVNKEGGQALVTAITFDGDSALYDVKYVLRGTVEKLLPEALLSVPRAVPSRATSSSSRASSETRRESGREVELQRQLADMKQKYENLKWQNAEQRALVARLRDRQKEASRQLATAAEENERVRVQRECDLKMLNDRALLVMEEAEEAAAREGKEARETMEEEHRLEKKCLQKEKRAAEKELEQTRQRSDAEQARLLSNVMGLLTDREDVVRVEMEKKVERSEQRVAELEKKRDDNSFLGICQKVLPPDKLAAVLESPYNPNTFRDSGTVDALHPRRQSALGKVVGEVVGAVLTAAHPDQPGALKAAAGRRYSAGTVAGAALITAGVEGGGGGGGCGRRRSGVGVGGGGGGGGGEAHSCSGGHEMSCRDGAVAEVKLVASAYVNAKKAGDEEAAKQHLSMLVSFKGLTESHVAELCTERTPLVVGTQVAVSFPGNVIKLGTLESVMSSSSSSSSSLDHTVLVAGVGDVDVSRVFNTTDVRCTQHAIRQAKLHASATYPGARVAAATNKHFGIEPPRADFVAKFLRDSTVVEVVEASLANASKGVKYRLKQRRWVLFHRLQKEMEAAKLKPVSWGYFWLLTSGKEYELLTVDNCCCGICRELGFENYDEMREIVNAIDRDLLLLSNDTTALPNKKKLLARIQKEEEFRRGLFATHLEAESECASHCMTMLLSTHCDSRFRKACAHPGGAGCGAEPKSMVELVREEHGRAPRPSDWHDTCEVCLGTHSGNALMCTHCNVIAHPACVKKTHNDLPQTKEESWTCWECVREMDAVNHSSSCNECNEAGFIVDDIQLGIELLSDWEKRNSATATSSATATTNNSSNNITTGNDGCIEVAASELLSARLQIVEAKQLKYHGHLIRDRNQSCFKELALETLPVDSFYLLVDYWAKVGIGKKGGTACCEGDQVGLSAHGGMFVYRNPTKKQRTDIDAKHGLGVVGWSLFGAASDDGGLEFLEEHFNVYCDDAKQNNYHTKSVLDASIAVFVEGRPWLSGARLARMQSDQAPNYRDPTTEIDLTCIGTRLYSTEGMGKDEGDAAGAVIKLHSMGKFSMASRQVGWLEEYVFKDRMPLMRPSVAWASMQAYFAGKLRADSMTPMWLEKGQIAKWIAAKKSEEKARRKDNKKTMQYRAESGPGAESGLPPPTTCQQKKSKKESKRKRLASTSTGGASLTVSS